MKRLFAVFAMFSALSAVVVAQQPAGRPSSMLEAWLTGPDRTDYSWQVRLSSPALTYQQRYLVSVSAHVDPSICRRKAGSRFRFVLRVADPAGNWFPGHNQAEYTIPSDTADLDHISFDSWVYLLPGDYRFALLMYDPDDHTGNVRHGWVHVPANKVLPDLARDLPAVEFPARVPGLSEGSRLKDPGVSLAHGIEYLPITHAEPLRIEVLLDFSELDEMDPLELFGPSASASSLNRTVDAEYATDARISPRSYSVPARGAIAETRYQANARRMLRVGTILSHLQPSSGCVRVSAVDTARMHVIADRQDARTLDWNKLEDAVIQVNHGRIEVATLVKQKERTQFVRDFLTRIEADSRGCGSGSVTENPVVLVVASDLVNPKRVRDAPLNRASCPQCRLYYLRMALSRSDRHDPYEKTLAPVQPRKMRFNTPLEFRKVLARLLKELGSSE